MKAIRDKIIVKAPSTQGATTPSGLFVPSVSDQAQYIKSEVVAVGTDMLLAGVIEEGQVIHFNRLAAPKIVISGEEFYVIRLDDVLAIE